MLLHRPLRSLAAAALAALIVRGAAAEPASTNVPSQPPPEQTITYADGRGVNHIYLLQEPQARPIATNAPILIYMHGAGGKEEQGMRTLFPGLRRLLDAWGWIYVCPRDSEYDGLRRSLAARYGPRTLFLAGASAGGRSVFWQAVQNPLPYSGLILMCPAIPPRTIPSAIQSDARALPMPLWMICGEQDSHYAATCRLLHKVMNARGKPVYYREIPGGDHDVPCRLIKWDEALRFVSEKSGANPAVQ